MPRHTATALLTALLGTLLSSAHVAADTVYRWRDATGALHFSNRVERVPASAIAVEVRPVAIGTEVRPVGAPAATPARRQGGTPAMEPAACDAPDARGIVDAVSRRLADTNDLGRLALLVAGVPVAWGPDAVVRVWTGEPSAAAGAALDQAAIAYPASAACPSRPALSRYPVNGGGPPSGEGLCADYRRAFAQVGITGNRNQYVARSFREIAEMFAAVAARGYTLDGGDGRGGIAPWIVEAHVAQADQIAGETRELVDELTVALEEIDRAARANGCW